MYKNKFILIFFILSVLRSTDMYSQNKDIEILQKRIVSKIISSNINFEAAQRYSDDISFDGSWADIDYANTSNSSWAPMRHLDRLLLMAQAYSKPESPLYGQNIIRDNILLGLKYWRGSTPKSINWFFNDIGSPITYSKIVLLLKGKVDHVTLFRMSSILKDQIDRFTNGAQNLEWIAEITQNKGIIEDNDSLICKAIKASASTLTVSNQDGIVGIKVDNSYHMHSTLFYSGGYGLSSVSSTLSNLELVYGTKYYKAYSSTELAVLGNYILDGLKRLSYKKIIDFSSIGRYIARKNMTNGISITTLDKLIMYDAARAADYVAYKKMINGSVLQNPTTKFFFKSDILTKNGIGYYMSARMISKRTVGTETTNGENLKGYYLPIGATNFYTSGNEYYNIMPMWNWSRIPGITAENKEIIYNINDKKTTKGTNDFAGGISDGINGICAFDGSFNDIKARKSYFIFGDAMLCLGSGISASKSNPILTSVNQCYNIGPINIMNGGNAIVTSKLELPSLYDSLKWVYHDNIGYIFPQSGKITVTNQKQAGSWSDINTSYPNSAEVKNIFSIWFDHSNTPIEESYEYIVAPNLSLEAFKKFYNNHGFVIVENSKEIQAIKNTKDNLFGVVFYSGGAVNFGHNFILSSDKPAIILISKSGKGYTISVSDPLFSSTDINLSFNCLLSGENVTLTNNKSIVNFHMPIGDLKGSGITSSYSIEPIKVAP